MKLQIIWIDMYKVLCKCNFLETFLKKTRYLYIYDIFPKKINKFHSTYLFSCFRSNVYGIFLWLWNYTGTIESDVAFIKLNPLDIGYSSLIWLLYFFELGKARDGASSFTKIGLSESLYIAITPLKNGLNIKWFCLASLTRILFVILF